MKINGLSCPLNLQQILAWFVFVLNIITFFIFTSAFFLNNTYTIFTLIFTILSLSVMITGLVATMIDPTDELLKIDLTKRKLMQNQKVNSVLEISKKFDFCVLCRSNINAKSKHCRACDKCVDRFDHHCIWLNNCIGEKNYKYFYLMLVFVELSLLFNICTYIYAFVLFINKDVTGKSEEKFVSPIISAVISLIVAVLDFAVSINITYLIYIHTWLRCNNLTTYEYIINKSEKKEVKDDSENYDIKVENNLKINDNLPDLKDENNGNEKKKERNKFFPVQLLNRIKEYESKDALKIFENKDKILIQEEDSTNKIFKLIVDEIYHTDKIKREHDIKYKTTNNPKNAPNSSKERGFEGNKEHNALNKNDQDFTSSDLNYNHKNKNTDAILPKTNNFMNIKRHTMVFPMQYPYSNSSHYKNEEIIHQQNEKIGHIEKIISEP